MVMNYKDIQDIYYNCAVILSDPNFGTITGAGIYPQNSEVTLSVEVNPKVQFIGWKIDNEIVSTEKSYTFNITNRTIITATFSLSLSAIKVYSSFRLTISPDSFQLIKEYPSFVFGFATKVTCSPSKYLPKPDIVPDPSGETAAFISYKCKNVAVIIVRFVILKV